jgi:hypothetical protein
MLDDGGLVADPSVRRQLGEVLALLTRTAG